MNVAQVEGILSRIDLRDYNFHLKKFDENPFREVRLEELEYSPPEESFWRILFKGRLYDAVKFTTPKRTRSFPFARTFELLSSSNKKLAFIPIVKDEGRVQCDYLGLETVAILNAFGVYVIISYYSDAAAKTNKDGKITITNQKLSFKEIAEEIKRIHERNVSPKEWNREMVTKFPFYLKKAMEAYESIRKKLNYPAGVFSSVTQIPKYLQTISEDGFDEYLEMRDGWKKKSQASDLLTIQPKEDVIKSLKNVKLDVTFEDNLGLGYPVAFHASPDEAMAFNNKIVFIEKKRNESFQNIEEHIFRMIMFERLKFDLSAKVYFMLGVTYDDFSGVCFSKCEHFASCKSESFKSCYDKKLRQYNNKRTIFQSALIEKLLTHCNLNEHLCFVAGKKRLSNISPVQSHIIRKST